MATRTFLSIIYLLYLVNFTVAFSLQHVMARLNSLEVKFDMENKLRRSETEELFRRVSEISTGGKSITASEHVSRDAPSDYGEPMSPKERVVPLDRITILPYTDKNKTTESALELYKLKSYLIEGAKVEKDKNLKLRIELKGIGNMLKTDYAMLNSNINEGIRNLTNHLTENRKLLEIDFAIFKSNIEAEILNLTKYLSENKHSVETDYASFKSNIREGIKHLKDGISENQKSQVSVERFDNFTDLVTTALSIASNESRQAITLLKSEFEMSMNKISNNASTVNNRQTEIEISMQKLSNDFSLVNKTLSSITDIQYELKYSIQELVFYANTKNRRSCRHSPDNGVYDIYPGEKSVSSIRVYCDQTTDGGRWIVFQRRQDGSVDFERTWADYKTGFGNLEGEFWIGNDNLHALTSAGFNELRIDLEDFEGNRAYAKYRNFKVKSESEKYELEVSGYSGDAGDSLTSWHNGMSFSTKDRDNDKRDGNCAIQFKGAWWYNSCHQANLNGYYFRVAVSPVGEGINWFHWKGWLYSLKRVDMKIR